MPSFRRHKAPCFGFMSPRRRFTRDVYMGKVLRVAFFLLLLLSSRRVLLSQHDTHGISFRTMQAPPPSCRGIPPAIDYTRHKPPQRPWMLVVFSCFGSSPAFKNNNIMYIARLAYGGLCVFCAQERGERRLVEYVSGGYIQTSTVREGLDIPDDRGSRLAAGVAYRRGVSLVG